MGFNMVGVDFNSLARGLALNKYASKVSNHGIFGISKLSAKKVATLVDKFLLSNTSLEPTSTDERKIATRYHFNGEYNDDNEGVIVCVMIAESPCGTLVTIAQDFIFE